MKVIKTDRAYVKMTKDKKCILRGSKETGYTLCLLDEKSKKKITEYKSLSKCITSREISLSEGVRKFYNTERYGYLNSGLPELIDVKGEYKLEIDI